MKLRNLVWRELAERPATFLTATLAIFLSVAALVAIRHVTVFSKRAIGQQLADLGANVLVLPKAATLQDYYAADLNEMTLPESHVSSILLANLPGVEKISPRLCVPTDVAGRTVTLTGILPQSEYRNQAAWNSVSLFSKKHVGCKKAAKLNPSEEGAPTDLASLRAIDKLAENEAILGADVAELAGLSIGQSLTLMGRKFTIVANLPRTGTVDDSRVFAHLHAVQELAGAGEVVNAIEVVGCCEDAATTLVPELSKLLPDAKVVTISQVVSTQVGVNRLLSQVSVLVLGILVVLGGASVASTIAANVRDRRREIGTLMALGAPPRLVTLMFLLKAWILGIVGSVSGCLLGIGAAMLLGTRWAGVAIVPLPGLALASIVAAVLVTTLAALWPARAAAKLDPCLCFQEI